MNNENGCLRQELINRAEMIVRGTQEPDSGWYNSPDDLVAIITLQLSRAYKDGYKDGLRRLSDTPHGELTAFGDTTARVVVEEVKGAAKRLAASRIWRLAEAEGLRMRWKWPRCKCGGVAVYNASGDITRTCIQCGSIVMPEYPSNDEMEADLAASGWTRKGIGRWEAPNGALYRGPFQAWKAMNGILLYEGVFGECR